MPVMRLLLVACLLGSLSATAVAIDWPIQPSDLSQPIGNSYGEYQFYGGSPYMHPGIDIMAPAGTAVYAVKSGYVKAVLTTSANLHWRVAIGDSAGAVECDGWLYAHLNETSINVYEGQWVDEGDYLGTLVAWPIAGFHHLHFVKIRHSGIVWSSDWQFIANPLDELTPIDDPDAPVFENAYGDARFVFKENGGGAYFTSGETLAGDVDIICRVYDYINHYDWRLTPYQLEYRIAGDSGVPWTNTVCFTGPLDYTENVDVVFCHDGTCNTYGDYDFRQYYFYLTNTDGDSIIEASDAAGAWRTSYFHNGEYSVYARAGDRFGNQTVDSMTVAVANFFALSGSVSFADGYPELSGVTVTADLPVVADTSWSDGTFVLTGVGGGEQQIHVSRPGYVAADTTIMMHQAQSLALTLQPILFVRGDVNFDGAVNVGDAVYVINYVFKNGPAPLPYYAGDANSDGAIDVGDAVFLINYIFRGGPPPMPTQPGA